MAEIERIGVVVDATGDEFGNPIMMARKPILRSDDLPKVKSIKAVTDGLITTLTIEHYPKDGD